MSIQALGATSRTASTVFSC